MVFHYAHGNYHFAHVMADDCRSPPYKISNLQISDVLVLLRRKNTTLAGFFTGNIAMVLPVLPDRVKKTMTVDELMTKSPLQKNAEKNDEKNAQKNTEKNAQKNAEKNAEKNEKSSQ